MKNNLSKRERKFLLFEGIFLVLALFYVFFINSPNSIYPVSGMVISEDNFLFEIENSQKVILADNPNFENAFVLKEDSEITLPPGEYYWKAVSWLGESETSYFTIESNVALELEEDEDSYQLRNVGNVDVDVNKGEVVGEFVLTPGQFKDIENETVYEGEQK